MPIPWIILFGLLWAAVIVLAVLALGLSRRVTLLAASIAAMQAPTVFSGPPFVGSVLAAPGHDVLAPLTESRNATVLFLNSTCGPCHALAEKLSVALERSLTAGRGVARPGVEIVVVTDAEGASKFGHLGRVVVQDEQEIAQALGVVATPAGLAVDSEGIVRAKTLPTTVADVFALIDASAPDELVPAATAN